MSRKLVTPPDAADPVITSSEAMDHARVDEEIERPKLAGLVETATKSAEVFTERRFVEQTWRLKRDCFQEVIELPFPPLISVESIKYIDTNGTEQTLDPSVYTVDTDSEPGRVFLAYDQSWPSIRSERQAVRVEFKCGYGAAADVPPTIKHAIKLLVAHWLENPEAVVVGSIVADLPFAVESLLWGETIPEAE